MSVHATAWAWDQPVSGNAKLVLLALADECRGTDGLCWPGLKRVAGMTGIEQRSVRRQLEVLEGKGLLAREERRRSDGSQTSNLIRLVLSTPPDASVLPSPDAGVLPRAVEQEPGESSTPSPEIPSEPIGFSEWLGFHHTLTGSAVPRAGTARRRKLASIFARLVGQGSTLEDFELESEGVFAAPHMQEGGHLEPENVLRVDRFGKYAAAGRRARAAAEKTSPYDALEDR